MVPLINQGPVPYASEIGTMCVLSSYETGRKNRKSRNELIPIARRMLSLAGPSPLMDVNSMCYSTEIR